MAARKKSPIAEIVTESVTMEPKPEPKPVKAEPKAQVFDPDAYLSATYGEMYDLVAVQRAILREIAILAHKG